MFGRATTFSNAVAQFDARLDQLSRNDAIAIQTLTMMAKQASISDASIFTACIIFRIITNPHKTKLPIIYLMDSITKNSGPHYQQMFGQSIGALMPAIFDLTETQEDRLPLLKLISLWKARTAFHPELLDQMEQSMLLSEKRRAIVPVSSGWPSVLPSGSEKLPEIELQIAQYFYMSIFPLASPTVDELNFTKDSLAVLMRLMIPLNVTLGRAQDPEIVGLLSQYDIVVQVRQKVSDGSFVSESMEANQSHPSSSSSHGAQHTFTSPGPSPNDEHLNGSHLGEYTHRSASPQPPTMEGADSRSSSVRPSISEPRTLSTYNKSAIDSLYKDLPHRCSTCGLRFKTNEELTAHLDWHYFERTSHLGRQGNRGLKLQRQWFLSASEWVLTCGGSRGQLNKEPTTTKPESSTSGTATDTETQNYIVRFDDAESETQAICAGCGDEIERPEYDDQGWFYPNTIRGPDSKLYHVKCVPESWNLNQPTDPSPRKKRSLPEPDQSFDELSVGPEAKKSKQSEST